MHPGPMSDLSMLMQCKCIGSIGPMRSRDISHALNLPSHCSTPAALLRASINWLHSPKTQQGLGLSSPANQDFGGTAGE